MTAVQRACFAFPDTQQSSGVGESRKNTLEVGEGIPGVRE